MAFFKTQQGMAQVDRSAYVTATISMPGQRFQSAIDWMTDKAISSTGDSLTVQIAPGGIAVVEIKVK
jgi:hypothetical protein